uniref:Uncharacterized protein n=1 Tax=Panagrolaimus sp. ES5 TaxID=591445 RepID=A0AC34GSA2_9BILA
MSSKAELMEKKLKEKLETDIVQVRDLSDGCGDKFDVVVASIKFKDLGTLARHRLMHKVLEDEFQHAHAITLHTFSVDEYEKAVECQLPKKHVLDEMKEI